MGRARQVVAVGIGTVAVLVGSVASAVALTGSAADSTPPEPSDVVAPIDGAARWLDGPTQDATDPDVGSYSFGSGFVQVPGRAIDRLSHTDPSEAGFRALAQDAYDSLLHMRPDTPLAHSGDTGHPAYTPDWDGDGIYGEAEDYDPLRRPSRSPSLARRA